MTASLLKTDVILIYESKDITKDVSKYLLSINYTDNADNEADTLTVVLEDREGIWRNSWTPQRNDKVQAIISTQGKTIDTGLMIIDNLRAHGSTSGTIFEFQAVSIPLNNTIRRTIKTRNFEKFSLQKIASQIASESNLKFTFDVQEDVEYDRVDQSQESDLTFLSRLCKDAGLSLKVAFEQLIIFDQKSYENKQPIAQYVLNFDDVLSWSFNSQQSERYKAVTVKWRDIKKKTVEKGEDKTKAISDANKLDDGYDINADPSSGANDKKGNEKKKPEIITYTFEDDTVGEGGQTYIVKKRCNSQKEAERVAKAKLRELNLRQTTGNLTVIGNPILTAGSVINLQNFGSFDGRFIIENVNHNYSTSGYTTNMNIRRVNENY